VRSLNAALLPAALALTALAVTTLGSPAADQPDWSTRRYHSVLLSPDDGPVRLFVEEAGAGPPILLIHGVGGSTYAWRKVAPRLAAAHRVIAIDLKGFGRSSKPGGSAYAPRDQARLIAQFLAKEDLEHVTLVGHSFGGTVALTLLLANREAARRVDRLVLIDSPAYPQSWPAEVSLLRDPLASKVALSLVQPELVVKLSFIDSLKSQSAVTSDDIDAYARPLYEEGASNALIQTVRQLSWLDLGRLSRGYPSIAIPALVVWCRDDPIVPLHTGLMLARALPNATLKIEPGCAHVPLEETPARLAHWILNFAVP